MQPQRVVEKLIQWSPDDSWLCLGFMQLSGFFLRETGTKAARNCGVRDADLGLERAAFYLCSLVVGAQVFIIVFLWPFCMSELFHNKF